MRPIQRASAILDRAGILQVNGGRSGREVPRNVPGILPATRTLLNNQPRFKMGTTKNLIAFAYYGGKNRHLEDILPLLPAADHYCEPFAGSASILLNREPSPIETLNDLNGDIVNFFRVLRDQPRRQRKTNLNHEKRNQPFRSAITAVQA